jgi:hypothetical protein
MSFVPRIPGSLGSHAASVAANARDGLRTAHYLVQELAASDDQDPQGKGRRKRPTWLLPPEAPTSLISNFISQNARIADKVMNWSSDAVATLLAPDWRTLPSPFNRNMMAEIAQAITSQGFTGSALFNAYFHRASMHILQRYAKPPFLVMENRIDAARRALGASEQRGGSDAALMARALIALTRAAPVVEAGMIEPRSVLAKTKDPNVSVASVACIALLFADQGKPTEEIDEDAFFAIVGALISPRLQTIEQLIARDDVPKLEAELASIKAMY